MEVQAAMMPLLMSIEHSQIMRVDGYLRIYLGIPTFL